VLPFLKGPAHADEIGLGMPLLLGCLRRRPALCCFSVFPCRRLVIKTPLPAAGFGALDGIPLH
jgi:hypothetical protein